MKTLITASLAVVLFTGMLGCEKSSAQNPQGKRLTLYKPADQTITRGETNQVALVIARENFSNPVTLRFENLPKGLTVVGDKVIPADRDRLVLTLHAAPDADLVANNEVRVVAEGPDGLSIAERFLLTVKDRDVAAPKDGKDSPF